MYALHAYIRMHYMHRNVCMRLANKLNISIGHGPLTFESAPGLPRPLPGRRDPPAHGSSEGHEMLKRNDKYHSIADDVPIPKM